MISRSLLNHFIKKEEKEKMLRFIKHVYQLTVASIKCNCNNSPPWEKVFCLNFQLLLGHSFPAVGAKIFAGCQQIHELPETHQQHGPWPLGSCIITWQGDSPGSISWTPVTPHLSACDAVVGTTQSKSGPALINVYFTKVDSDGTFSTHVKSTNK